MKLSELKQVLADAQLQLTKSLGQNFLHDANQLRRIMDTAELARTDRVLEIGPGLGPLTERLLARAGEVLAIEKDGRLVELLRERLPAHAHLKLIHADALDYLQTHSGDWSAWKLVANLPYSVASPILVQLALSERGPQRMVVTLQLEVARRLVARAGEKDYGVLTLLVQLHYQPRGWFKIPAGCFFPQPEVDSACVCLCRQPAPLTAPQTTAFVAIVKRSFSQRRKMFFKLLKADWPEADLERAFEQAALSLQARAETVTLEQFVGLTKSLTADSEK
jgi:16S rRNA (adenine1518-N6/adenine1519-N6)-dimethyltransferase